MAMNYEFERHIQAAQEANNAQGAKALKSLQDQYEILALNGIVPILQKEQVETKKEDSLTTELPSDLPFSRLLKFFRTQKGLSQVKLGRQAQVDPNYISRLEREIYKTPKPVTITKICAGFGWSPEDPNSILLAEKATEMRLAASLSNQQNL